MATEAIAYLIFIFINRSFMESYFLPLHKGGNFADFISYSLTVCLFSEILDKYVHKKLLKKILDNDVFCPSQHDFRPHYSTTTAFLNFTNNISQYSNSHNLVALLFLDLSKVFNTVSHAKLPH